MKDAKRLELIRIRVEDALKTKPDNRPVQDMKWLADELSKAWAELETRAESEPLDFYPT